MTGVQTCCSSDLLAATAASGFAASFAATGLKMGTGPAAGKVLRADGTPATADDVARLRAQIASDPLALARRPDFFNVVDRPAFGRLKSDFHGKPDARDGVFRHVGLTEKDRDFQRTASCNPKLEKDCNTASEEAYKKGEFVTPEDLKAIEEALRADEEEEAAELAKAAAGESEVQAGGAAVPAKKRRRRSRPLVPYSFAAGAASSEARLVPGAETGSPGPDAAAGSAAGAPAPAGRKLPYPMRHVQTGALVFVVAAWLYGRRRKRSFLEGNR